MTDKGAASIGQALFGIAIIAGLVALVVTGHSEAAEFIFAGLVWCLILGVL